MQRFFLTSDNKNIPEEMDDSESKFAKYTKQSLKLHDGPPVRYQLLTREENLDKLSNEESKLRKFTFGERNPSYPNRTVLLVGATGSGKSSLINALVNSLMGVKFEDELWFEIVKDDEDQPLHNSQTTAVCVYQVFGFEETTAPYSLTIIDTPGYGHTKGSEYDQITTDKLKDLFCISDGVDTIDVVGLVLKATENRLDKRMAYIFNSITSLFGKNMEKNIVAMMTHSDGNPPENAILALECAKIKCARNQNNEPMHFLFNNRQNKKTTNPRAAEYAFETSEEGIKNFIDFLGKCQPQTLKTTVGVLKDKIQLTACIQNLKERVATIEAKEKAMRKNKEVVNKHEQEMNDKKNFTIAVQETHKSREKIAGWWDNKAVTCLRCEENCHYPGCTWAWSPSWCEIMKDDKCTVCSEKCPVEDHVKEKWRYVTKTRTVQKTSEEMKAKFDENKTEHKEKTTLLEQMQKEIDDLQKTKNHCLDEAFNIIEELDQIALNVNTKTFNEHLKFLIEKMREKGDTEKVQKLEKMTTQMDVKNRTGATFHSRK